MVRELPSRADQRVLRWVWHIERMDEHHMARRVLMTDVSRGRVRSKRKLGWMDGVKVTLLLQGQAVLQIVTTFPSFTLDCLEHYFH